MITIDTQVQEKIRNNKPKKILVISLVAFILLAFAVSTQLAYTVLKSDKIYKGVYINDLNASNLTKDELSAHLSEKYQSVLNNSKVVLKTEKFSEELKFSDATVSFDISTAVENAYTIGRKGSVFQKLSEIFKTSGSTVKIAMPINYDKNALDKAISSFKSKVELKVREAELFLDSDSPSISAGHHGESLDVNKVGAEIEKMFTEGKSGTLEITLLIETPKKLDVDELFSKITTLPVNATTKTDGKTYEIIPHIDGRTIDKSMLTTIVDEINNNEDITRSLPIEFTPAEITTQMLEASMFKDTIGSLSTQFSTSDQNGRSRAVNIKLASSKIDGLILAPGDEFSFNKVVGPRTEKGGYMAAHTYNGGRVVDGVGGGICQVSSTLYNAVLQADLAVTERRNHYFTVGYVPKGQDATVSYGSQDFKFKNSSNWPVKIRTWMTPDNRIHFSLLGTIENPNRQVSYLGVIIETIKFTVKYIDDPTLPVGTNRTKQNGMTGYVVDTYKIVKLDGIEDSKVKLHRSRYRALTKEVLRGTKVVTVIKPSASPVPTPKPSPAVSPTPAATATPVPAATPSSSNTVDNLDNVDQTEVPAAD